MEWIRNAVKLAAVDMPVAFDLKVIVFIIIIIIIIITRPRPAFGRLGLGRSSGG